MKKNAGFVMLVAVIFVFICAGGASASTLVNGRFETGDFTGWTTSAASGAYWQVVAGADNQNGYVTSPTEGTYMAKIYGGGYNSFKSNRLSQTFSVANGNALSFDYIFFAPDYPFYECPGFEVDLTLNGSTTNILSINDPGVGTQVIGWNNFSYDLEGYTGLIGLDFYCGNTYDDALTPWAYIGGVEASSVPEPATLLLLGSGLVGMAGGIRKKRRKKNRRLK